MSRWYTDAAAPAPSLIVPPACAGTQGNTAVWFAANWDMCMKFDLSAGGWYRYLNWRCNVQSGNVQLSVVRFIGTGDAPTYERVATSGIIACPAAGNIRTDLLGRRFYLPPGRYGLSLWADNVTFSTFHSNQVKEQTLRESVHLAGGFATGVPRVGTANSITNRWVELSLEGDI